MPNPALFTKISICALAPRTACRRLEPQLGWLRSATSGTQRTAYVLPSSLASCSSLVCDRATKTRLTPSAASFRAIASPIPADAPVTRAVLPFKVFMVQYPTFALMIVSTPAFTEKELSLNFGADMAGRTLFDATYPSVGIPRKFLSILPFMFSSCRTINA